MHRGKRFIVNHGGERSKNDPHINPNRPVFDIGDIAVDASADGCVAAITADLRQSRDAGLDHMANHVQRNLVAELLDKMRDFRTRSDDAHIAFQHVDELRKLVDGQLANQRAEESPAVVLVGRPCAVLAVIGLHTAEFEHFKRLFIFADAGLREENRVMRGQAHADCRDEHQRRKQNQRTERNDDINRALDERIIQAVERNIPNADPLDIFKFAGHNLIDDALLIAGDDAQRHAVFFTQSDNAVQQHIFAGRKGDDGFINRR